MPISNKTYYLNADRSKIVEGDSPEAAFLLVAEGGTIDQAEADKYGLTFGDEQKTQGAPPPAPSQERQVNTKRHAGPSEDK